MRDTKTTKTAYVATGSIRGTCEHHHDTPVEAQACADADKRAVRRAYPGSYPTSAYSDRAVRVIDEGNVRDLNEREIAAIKAYEDEKYDY
jgi:hypothetical protein